MNSEERDAVIGRLRRIYDLAVAVQEYYTSDDLRMIRDLTNPCSRSITLLEASAIRTLDSIAKLCLDGVRMIANEQETAP